MRAQPETSRYSGVPLATLLCLFAVAASASTPRSLSFEENLGQTAREVRFLARTGDAVLYLTAEEAVLALDGLCPAEGRAVVRWRVVSDNSPKQVEGIEETAGQVSYYLGDDPSRWVTGAPRFARVRYRDVRPGIDLIYRGSGDGAFAFDFIVAPGADPGQLQLQFMGADSVAVEGGDLVIRVAGREAVRQRPPVAYQESARGLVPVTAAFDMRGNDAVGFHLGAWDRALELVIDPTVALYLGGSDTEEALKVFQSVNGSLAIVAGWTRSLDFPTLRPVQGALVGGTDAFFAALTPAGDDFAAASYLGGSSDDRIEGIATHLDWGTSIYLVGTTSSPDFPVTSGSPAYAGGSSDAFMALINPIGSPWVLVYSQLLGGSGDDEAHAAIVTSDRQPYVVGATSSRDFPVVNAWQPLHGGGTWDGFLHRSAAPNPVTTYVGGSGDDSLVDIEGEYSPYYQHEVVMIGNTTSPDFPTVAPLQATYAGGGDAIVAAIAADHSGLVYATYLGGSGRDEAHRIDAIWGTGEAHVAGTTDSPDFPVRNAIQPTLAGGSDAFFALLTSSGNALRFSTYFGGSADDRGGSIELLTYRPSNDWSIAVSGNTRSADLPTLYALQPSCASCPVADAFFARLAPDGSELLCASFLGGTGEEGSFVDLDLDSYGGGWTMAGTTESADFPFLAATGRPYSGGRDAFTFSFDQLENTPDDAGNVLHAVKRMAGASIEWTWSSAPRALGHNLRSDLQKGGSFPRLVAAEKTGGLSVTIPMLTLDLVFYQLKGVACGGQGP